MTYHINPETGRPNICRASIRECRFGSSSQHFETKQAAAAFSEKVLTEEHGIVATLKKVPEVSQISSKKEMAVIEKELGVLPTEKLHTLVKQRLRLAMTPRELEKHLNNEGGYESASFYARYTGNQEMSLDYNNYVVQKTFTKGACAMLASELNRVTDLPLVVFTHDKEKSTSWNGHAVIKLPNNEYFDINGPSDRRWLLSEFAGSDSWTEDELTIEEFNKLVGVKKNKTATDDLEPLEKAALAKVCFDLIRDYSLNDPARAGECRF
jgi:hypothetical protein